MHRRLRLAGLCLLAAALLALWLVPALHRKQERAALPATPAPQPSGQDAPTPSPLPSMRAAAPTPNAPPAAPAAPAPRPRSTIRIAFETEPRDANAAAVEARIRDIYANEPLAQGVLRQVRCTRTVCKLDARWSQQLNRGYNAALMQVIREFTRELSFEPDGLPDALGNPVTLYVRRPAHPAPAPGPAATTPKNAAPAP